MRYLFFLFVFLYSHPINLTKMDLNSSILHMRFVSYNLEREFSKEYENMDEIKKDTPKIYAYTKKHLLFKNCTLTPLKLTVKNEIVIDEYFKLSCPQYNRFDIFFDMFTDKDKTQIGVLKIGSTVLNFSAYEKKRSITLHNKSSFASFLKLGVMHILEGVDHITFLLMLLLPAVMYGRDKKESLKNILLIISAFTLSHSVSLSLSAFEILTPEPKIIEILIAVSIFFTAFNNIVHLISYQKEWLIAFFFGFIHGFAFSEALRGLDVKLENFVKIVLGFNIGVEIGQILIVLVFLPIMFFIIKRWKKAYTLLSVAGIFMSAVWMMERIGV